MVKETGREVSRVSVRWAGWQEGRVKRPTHRRVDWQTGSFPHNYPVHSSSPDRLSGRRQRLTWKPSWLLRLRFSQHQCTPAEPDGRRRTIRWRYPCQQTGLPCQGRHKVDRRYSALPTSTITVIIKPSHTGTIQQLTAGINTQCLRYCRCPISDVLIGLTRHVIKCFCEDYEIQNEDLNKLCECIRHKLTSFIGQHHHGLCVICERTNIRGR